MPSPLEEIVPGSSYVVYALQDPTDMSIRYVGMSSDVFTRYHAHLRLQDDNEEKNAWIRRLRLDGLRPHLVILETPKDIHQTKKRESYWIAHYKSELAPLTNIAETRAPFRDADVTKRDYPLICLGSSWGGIFLSAGKTGWINSALTEPERLSSVVPAVRRYCGRMRQYGIAGYMKSAEV